MHSERFILEVAFPASSNVSSKQTRKQKPHKHMWRSKLWVAFKPPVQGATLVAWDVPAMERSEWRCWQMERQGCILAQGATVLICWPFGSPVSLSPGSAVWAGNGGQQQSRSCLQAGFCMRVLLSICAAGRWPGGISWRGTSEVCSAFAAENMEAERAGGGHSTKPAALRCPQGEHRPHTEPEVCTSKTAKSRAWRAHIWAANRREITQYCEFWERSNLISDLVRSGRC